MRARPLNGDCLNGPLLLAFVGSIDKCLHISVFVRCRSVQERESLDLAEPLPLERSGSADDDLDGALGATVEERLVHASSDWRDILESLMCSTRNLKGFPSNQMSWMG